MGCIGCGSSGLPVGTAELEMRPLADGAQEASVR